MGTVRFTAIDGWQTETRAFDNAHFPTAVIIYNEQTQHWMIDHPAAKDVYETYPIADAKIEAEKWTPLKIWGLWRKSHPESSLTSLISELSQCVKVVGSWGLMKNGRVSLTLEPNGRTPTDTEMQTMADILNAYSKHFNIEIEWR